MTSYIERVLIVLNPDGTLKGAHAERLIDGVRQEAAPLTPESLAGVIPSQAALLVRLQTQEATAAAELAAVEQELAVKQAALTEALNRAEALQAEKDAAALSARQSVSPAAARVVLRNAGLLTAVEAAVEAADPHSDLRIFWEYSEVWRRVSPFISQMGAALGLTSQQIDDLFAQAASL